MKYLKSILVAVLDNQIFDVVISINKDTAYGLKVKKYANTSFLTKVIPIAIDYYFEMHNLSYNRLTKYMNGNVLKQIIAF